MERLPDFEGLALFVRISEAGSISAVGRELGLPKSTVSKRLCSLEERLGVQLINRTTRRMSLTDAGRSLLERARRVVREISNIEQEAVARAGLVEGRVRLAVPVGFGQVVVLPLLRKFLDQYPAISLEMSFDDRPLDMIEERFDLMVRCGTMADTSLIARHLRDCKRLVVASPGYVQKAPPLKRATDLRNHPAITLAPDDDRWTFVANGDEISIHVHPRVSLQNLFAIRQATIDGLGVSLLPDYIVAEDLERGALISVMPEVGESRVPAQLLYPASHVQPAAVRKAAEFLVRELRHHSPV